MASVADLTADAFFSQTDPWASIASQRLGKNAANIDSIPIQIRNLPMGERTGGDLESSLADHPC
ncbi:MAG: hypothetical protein ACOZAM_16295 [Pseudomonadota bacterium]